MFFTSFLLDLTLCDQRGGGNRFLSRAATDLQRGDRSDSPSRCEAAGLLQTATNPTIHAAVRKSEAKTLRKAFAARRT
jgi:hypothetical protein